MVKAISQISTKKKVKKATHSSAFLMVGSFENPFTISS